MKNATLNFFKFNLILLLLFFLVNTMYSQNLNEKEIYKLKKLNINTEKVDLTDLNLQLNLKNILNLDRKRKTNKTVAIVYTSISAASLLLGGVLVSKNNGLADLFGGIMITSGVVYGGISIPFWIASNKRKKERDKLINLFE